MADRGRPVRTCADSGLVRSTRLGRAPAFEIGVSCSKIAGYASGRGAKSSERPRARARFLGEPNSIDHLWHSLRCEQLRARENDIKR